MVDVNDDPVRLAQEVVMDALEASPELFVAMHYLGLIDGNAMRMPDVALPPKADAAIVVMDQLPPVAAPIKPLHQVVYDASRWTGQRARTPRQSSSSFAQWVNGEIAYHPSVLGWDADDPRNWPRGE